MPHPPDSDDLDRLLADDPEAGEVLPPRDDVEVLLEVAVDAATLNVLTDRAAREGRDVGEVVAEVVRGAAA
jgi:hypothetical protein